MCPGSGPGAAAQPKCKANRIGISDAVFSLWGATASLPGQSPGARFLVRGRQVESLAALAAIDLGIRAELLSDLLTEEVPALQVTRTELGFLVLLIAGAHPGDAALHFDAVAEGRDEFGDRHWFVRGGVLGIGHGELR